jgi:hypothetical protein
MSDPLQSSGSFTTANVNGDSVSGPVVASLSDDASAPPGNSSIVVNPISAASAGGSLNAGKTVTFTLTISEGAQVAGSPALQLSNGATASYDTKRSTSTSLMFDYTVAAGQDTSDLQVSGLTLNGATIANPGTRVSELGHLCGAERGIGQNGGCEPGW